MDNSGGMGIQKSLLELLMSVQELKDKQFTQEMRNGGHSRQRKQYVKNDRDLKKTTKNTMDLVLMEPRGQSGSGMR